MTEKHMPNKLQGEKRQYGEALCAVCGEVFMKHSGGQKCCSPACSRENQKRREAMWREVKAPKPEPKTKVPCRESIADICKKAQAVGMTYGKYLEARANGRIST